MDSLGIPCYVVIALDDELYEFLHNWKPEHVIRPPAGFASVIPRQYAVKGSGAMKHLSRVRIATLKAITDQVWPFLCHFGPGLTLNLQCLEF